MAEHDEKLFEQEIAKMLEKMDSEIEIPEIPDVQTIFDRAEAEEKKSKVIPFKKYSRYIAAAAAVVLVCVSVPVFAEVLSSGGFAMAANDAAEMEPCEAPRIEEDVPEAEEPGDFPEENFDGTHIIFTESSESSAHMEESESENVNGVYYPTTDDEMKDSVPEAKIDESMSSSVASSSVAVPEKSQMKDVLYSYFARIEKDNPSMGGEGYDDVKDIEEYINKKRCIDITIEDGYVSVMLHDNTVNEETIAAFWVEGNYEDSYLDGEYYIIELSKKIDKEELDMGYYLPMAGDENGTYAIPESSISVPGEVRKGVISLRVSIHVGTGEYKIYAELV